MGEIFAEAAALPPADRPAFLAAACAGQDELRAEIESLLAFDPGASSHLARAVGEAAADVIDEPDQIGCRFGQYRATALIGSGGMGRVYLGVRDDNQFYKQVAIKLIKRGMDTESVVERFRRERQILAKLDHPNIAKLLDAGSSESGLPYFVMEHIDGMPIDEYCESRQLSVEERCVLFRRVCDAVSYAHRNLVIHRDLKPGNIMVTTEGAPKLLDFGIARLLDPESGSASGPTSLLRPITPDYGSPEQVRGEAITTATDVYALGGVLYRLLTGKTPLRLEGRTPRELERAVCEEEPARPSEAGPAKSRKGLAGDLDNIILMALRKEPERRYQFVDQLSDDLRRHAEGLPVTASEDTLLYRMARFTRRHRLPVIAAGLVAVTLAGGVVAATWEARLARKERIEADFERRRAEARAGQIAEMARNALFGASEMLVRVPGATEARKQLVGSTAEILDNLAQTSDRDPRIMDVLSLAYMRLADLQGAPGLPSLGDTEGAVKSLHKAVAALDRIKPESPQDASLVMRRIDLEQRLGQIYGELGRGPESLEHHHAQLAAAVRLAALQPKDLTAEAQVAAATVELAMLLSNRDVPEASKYGTLAVERWERLAAKQPDDHSTISSLATAYTAESAILGRLEEPVKAFALQKKALTIREHDAELRPQDAIVKRSLLITLLYVGDSLGDGPFGKQLGTPQEATPYYQRAVQIAEELINADPGNAAAQLEYAQALVHLGVVTPAPEAAAESMRALRKGAALTEAMLVKDPHSRSRRENLCIAYQMLGERMAAQGKALESLRYMKNDLAMALALFAEGDLAGRTQTVRAYRGIALAQAALGNREPALDAIRKMSDFSAGLLKTDPTAPVLNAYVHLSESARGAVYDSLAVHSSGQRASDLRNACQAYSASVAGFSAMPGAASPRFQSDYRKAEQGLRKCKAELESAGQ